LILERLPAVIKEKRLPEQMRRLMHTIIAFFHRFEPALGVLHQIGGDDVGISSVFSLQSFSSSVFLIVLIVSSDPLGPSNSQL